MTYLKPSSDRVWLILIIVLAVGFRCVGLSTSPAGPNQDEISNAIDARCLAETGMDRHGRWLPVYLRAYDDYREALFVYVSLLVAPFCAPWIALRVTAAVAGVLTVALVYGVTKRTWGIAEARWAGLFIACDPQHLLWSRLGMEVILVPLGVALVLWSASKSQTHPRSALLLGAVALLFTMYSGMMGKPAAAILLVGILVTPTLWCRWRLAPWVVLAGTILAIGSIPAWWSTLSPEATQRWAGIRLQASDPLGILVGAGQRWLTYWSPGYALVPGSEGLPDLPWAAKMGPAAWLSRVVGLVIALGSIRSEHVRMLAWAGLIAFVPAAFTATIAPSRVIWALPILAVLMGKGAAVLTSGRWRPVTLPTLIVLAGISAGLVAVDLARNTPSRLDQFFWQDYRRAVERLAATESAQRVVDGQLPWAAEFVIHATNAPVREFQGQWGSGRLAEGLVLGGIAIQSFPPTEGVFLTHDQGSALVPNRKWSEGRFSLYQFPSP